jgi:hypothetical protein
MSNHNTYPISHNRVPASESFRPKLPRFNLKETKYETMWIQQPNKNLRAEQDYSVDTAAE